MRHNGVIKKVNVDRGYCFLRVPNEADVFAHITAFSLDGQSFDESLQERPVTFEIVDGRDGRAKAINVQLDD